MVHSIGQIGDKPTSLFLIKHSVYKKEQKNKLYKIIAPLLQLLKYVIALWPELYTLTRDNLIDFLLSQQYDSFAHRLLYHWVINPECLGIWGKPPFFTIMSFVRSLKFSVYINFLRSNVLMFRVSPREYVIFTIDLNHTWLQHLYLRFNKLRN